MLKRCFCLVQSARANSIVHITFFNFNSSWMILLTLPYDNQSRRLYIEYSINARIIILLESASIQSKNESIADFEQLCEQISYLAGGNPKFDMMITIIRTYRCSLNQYEKADKLEQKMRNGMF